MNRQRGFASLITLLIWAGIAAAIAGAVYVAWQSFKDGIGRPYAEAQRVADQKIVDKANAAQAAAEGERDRAVGDTQQCVATQARQSDAVLELKRRADANAGEARRLKEQAMRDATAAAPKIADLQAKAAAAPKLLACEDELARAKDVLRDALRTRRGLPTGPAK